jgi:hypothetical protein
VFPIRADGARIEHTFIALSNWDAEGVQEFACLGIPKLGSFVLADGQDVLTFCIRVDALNALKYACRYLR